MRRNLTTMPPKSFPKPLTYHHPRDRSNGGRYLIGAPAFPCCLSASQMLCVFVAICSLASILIFSNIANSSPPPFVMRSPGPPRPVESDATLAEWNKPYHVASTAINITAAIDNIHLVVVIPNCSKESLWRSVVLEHSARRVGHRSFTRLVRGCASPRQTNSYNATFHTPTTCTDIACQFTYWITHALIPEDVVAWLELDSFFLTSPLTQHISPPMSTLGWPAAQDNAKQTHSFDLRAFYRRHCKGSCRKMNPSRYQVGPPYLMVQKDWVKVCEKWGVFREEIAKTETNPWLADILSLDAASAHAHLHFFVLENLVVVGDDVKGIEGFTMIKVPSAPEGAVGSDCGPIPPLPMGAGAAVQRLRKEGAETAREWRRQEKKIMKTGRFFLIVIALAATSSIFFRVSFDEPTSRTTDFPVYISTSQIFDEIVLEDPHAVTYILRNTTTRRETKRLKALRALSARRARTWCHRKNGEVRRVASRVFHMVIFNNNGEVENKMLTALITHVAAYVDALIVVESTGHFVIPSHASVDVLHVVVRNVSAFQDRQDNGRSESFAREISMRRAGLAVLRKMFAVDDTDVVILGAVDELPPLKYLPLLRHCHIAPRELSKTTGDKIQFLNEHVHYWLLPMRSFFYNVCCMGRESLSSGRNGFSFVIAAHVSYLRLHLATARTPNRLILPDDAATLQYGWHLSPLLMAESVVATTCRRIPNGTAFNVIPAAAREAFGDC